MTTRPQPVPVLATDRLVLREWRDTDRAPFAALNGDPEVMRHFPSTLTPTESDELVDRIVSSWARNGFGLWAVERVDTATFVGFVGLSSPTWSSTPLVEVGWRLARNQWGLGFAPEAATAALRFGFEHVAVPDNEIVSFTTVANAASRRVMEKIGLRHHPDRDFDHPLLPGWHGSRHVLYAISRLEHDRRTA